MSSEPRQPDPTTPDAEETESRTAVPMWLIILLAMLAYWGALYFDQRGGWFSAQVYAPYNSYAELETYQPAGGSGLYERGKQVYNRSCVACHQANGMGAPGQFPPLVESEWVNEPGPGRFIRLVLQGMTGPLTVKGQTYNNTMVPWNTLSDEDIAAVITYVRQNKEWGNDAPEVTPEQVAAVREKVKNHPGPFTADELMKIDPNE